MIETAVTPRWPDLAERALAGDPLPREDALAVLRAPDEEILGILDAAYRVRRARYGRVVYLNYLVSAKSGICPEDCGYCSQSKVSGADIPVYPALPVEEIVARVDRGVAMGASTCCIVMSGRGPGERDLARVEEATRAVKERHPGLRICACLGLLSGGQADRLREAGVDRYNHNLNTAESRYEEICSTHTFADRAATVATAAKAGISPCSGVIVGMGESDEDLVDAAIALRDVGAESIPVNFLVRIDGTPLSDCDAGLTPIRCLKVLAMFRFVCPDREIRVSAGREVHLRTLQPLALFAANSIFTSDYLTTPGQEPELDRKMIEDLGFSIEAVGAPRP